MKLLTSFLLIAALVVVGCDEENPADSASSLDFSTPQKTYEILAAAIQAKNMEIYKKCWSKNARSGESMIDELSSGGEIWSELQEAFKGPPTMTGEITGNKYHGEAAVIGAITMIKDGDEWKLYSW